ncbi:GerAB/ArcD/ProY family transporter [Bacillus thermotolerans]|uniref:GerAB/ArcD/ProY family transporter n=1 Tax=Bacillus thermotolerans TaxID=1221996 RepID=UPI000589628F|nr:GerAB/ArcD/ProY family transporter [Bacillus thermotolerans]KKB38614.1 spore germination protein [Bacillus thermotolerans]
MLPLPGEDKQVSPYLAFYVIVTVQVGVAILSFESNLVKDAGQDMWISILMAAAATHVLIWMTYRILNKGENDVTVIHRQLFGKWIGGLLSFLFIMYLFMIFVLTLRTYIEVIQLWMFPQIQNWYVALIIAAIVYLYVIGGFRVIVGLCVISFFLTIPLLALKIFPLKEGLIIYLFPLFDHHIVALVEAAKTMALNYSGFEILFFCYPFFKQAPQSHKWAQLGSAASTFIYLAAALVSIMYFTKEHLAEVFWPTLTLWKIVDLPFMERLEYVGVALWLFVILPNLCLYLWSATRGLKQLFSIRQKKSLILFLFLGVLLCTFLTKPEHTERLLRFINEAGLYVMYIYIPFLYVYQLIYHKLRGQR